MKLLQLVLLVGCALLAVALVREARMNRAMRGELSIWKAKYAEASTQRRVDSVAVVKWVTRTKTLRDTIDIHDTLQVTEYIHQTDTLRLQCMRCLASAAALQQAGDTVIQKMNQRRWYDRVGLFVGYGQGWGQAQPGLVAGVGVRVFP